MVKYFSSSCMGILKWEVFLESHSFSYLEVERSENRLQNHLNRIHTALITFHIKISSASRRDKSCNYPTGLVSPRVSLKNVSPALFQENALFQSSIGEEYKKTPREALDITLNSR